MFDEIYPARFLKICRSALKYQNIRWADLHLNIGVSIIHTYNNQTGFYTVQTTRYDLELFISKILFILDSANIRLHFFSIKRTLYLKLLIQNNLMFKLVCQ